MLDMNGIRKDDTNAKGGYKKEDLSKKEFKTKQDIIVSNETKKGHPFIVQTKESTTGDKDIKNKEITEIMFLTK